MRTRALIGTAIMALAIAGAASGSARPKPKPPAKPAAVAPRPRSPRFSVGWSLAVGPGGRVYLANWDRLRVYEYSSRGTLIRTWALRKSDMGSSGTYGLGVDDNGRVYAIFVGRVSVFSPEGKRLWRWDFPASSRAGNVTVGGDGAIYSWEAKRILKLDGRSGRLLLSFDLPKPGLGPFEAVMGEQADRAGLVHVWTGAVLLDSSGQADTTMTLGLYTFSSAGELRSSGVTPVHVAAWGPDGSIYTYQGNDIVKCQPDGQVLKRWGPFPLPNLRGVNAQAILVVPSETEMYRFATAGPGSPATVERISQENGRLLARWTVK